MIYENLLIYQYVSTKKNISDLLEEKYLSNLQTKK